MPPSRSLRIIINYKHFLASLYSMLIFAQYSLSTVSVIFFSSLVSRAIITFCICTCFVHFRCCLLSVADFNFSFDGNIYLLWPSLKKTMFFDGTFPFFLLRNTRPVGDFFVELTRPICLLHLNVIYLRTLIPKTYNDQSYNILVSVLEIFWYWWSFCRSASQWQSISL